MLGVVVRAVVADHVLDQVAVAKRQVERGLVQRCQVLAEALVRGLLARAGLRQRGRVTSAGGPAFIASVWLSS